KDISYLKNSVAHYRRVIDKTQAERSSVGESMIPFESNPIKTFSRRYTSYFIEGTKPVSLASFATAKALGEEIGQIVKMSRDSFTVKTECDFSGGDGVCFIDKNGNFGGTNINSARREGDFVTLYPNVMEGISEGAMLYRNSDKKYIDQVTNAKITRQIKTSLEVNFGEKLELIATDSSGMSARLEYDEPMEAANNVERAATTIRTQLSKSG
ncbi:MAG: DUF3656 domain-containing protein, partial [Rikenellaceae bacterium]